MGQLKWLAMILFFPAGIKRTHAHPPASWQLSGADAFVAIEKFKASS
jgi:hypothetical protein